MNTRSYLCIATCSVLFLGACLEMPITVGNNANFCSGDSDCKLANATSACSASACAITNCVTGYADCDRDPSTGCESETVRDPGNCGACGHACAAGQSCRSSACVSPMPDAAACEVTCTFANGEGSCEGKVCTLASCVTGWGNCNQFDADGCETNLSSDAASCGACGNACGAGNTCISGACSVPPSCGHCALPNASVKCVNGQCEIGSCNTGFGDCDDDPSDGCETSLTSDSENCGGCAEQCNGGWSCCSSKCSNPTNDVSNCGACGQACSSGPCVDGACEMVGACGPCALPNATSACKGNACAIAQCNTGYGDCNGDASDGCEVYLDSSLQNCGACGTLCGTISSNAPSGTCVAGKCQCPLGYLFSGQGCVACGGAVNNGTTVVAGTTCHLQCFLGYGDCDGLPVNGCEVSLLDDPQNCGACGNACQGGAPCQAAVCQPSGTCSTCMLPNAVSACENNACAIVSCVEGAADCDFQPSDGCEVATGTDPENCGGCGRACSINNVPTPTCTSSICTGACFAGYADCNDDKLTDGCEVAIEDDPESCGGCGMSCSLNNISMLQCSNGVCVGSCLAGFEDCNGDKLTDGCEANRMTDPVNCGGCGVVCSNANIMVPTCTSGLCDGTCEAGYLDCDSNKELNGCEVNATADVNSCGACNRACSLPHAQPRCVAGACAIDTCLAPFADCDADPADGCETNTASDVNNCGACGNSCGMGNTCVSGVCSQIETLCNPGLGDCDHDPADGCETNLETDPLNCGACGQACNGGWLCCGGVCSNSTNDVTSCGACGAVCVVPNGIPSCQLSHCAIQQCNAGWADCDGEYADGCETSVVSDTNNCGACNQACLPMQSCVSGACQ